MFLGTYRLDGIPMADLKLGFPEEEEKDLRELLQALREERRIRTEGVNRWTRYFPATAEGGIVE